MLQPCPIRLSVPGDRGCCVAYTEGLGVRPAVSISDTANGIRATWRPAKIVTAAMHTWRRRDRNNPFGRPALTLDFIAARGRCCNGYVARAALELHLRAAGPLPAFAPKASAESGLIFIPRAPVKSATLPGSPSMDRPPPERLGAAPSPRTIGAAQFSCLHAKAVRALATYKC